MDSTDDYLQLNTAAAQGSYSTVWGAAVPTSSVFGATCGGLVPADATGVAYCFAEIKGYSKFGTYTGNASTDGPFVNTGFRPAVMISKRIDSGSTDDWEIVDSVRNTYNDGATCALWPGGAGDVGWDESCHANYATDFLANGFKIRSSHAVINASGTYIYIAFAESPFKYANAR